MKQTAADIWKEIRAKRNFDEKYYDIKEAEYIKNTLGLPIDKTILVGLKKRNVSVEEFVKVFFEANQSYSNMMNDLLNMFQEIGAKQTDHQIEICFEFDKGMPYTVDLSFFKSQIEKWKTIEKEILIPGHPIIKNFNEFSIKLRMLNFPGNIDYEVINYKNFNIEFNQTDNIVLNDLLNQYKDFLIEVVKEVKKYGTEKKTLGEKRSESEYAEIGLDNWPWLVSSQLQKLALNFDGLDKETQEKCLNTLQEFLKLNGFKKQTIQDRVNVLEDYLDLPFWKKRYELYSVWIFKLIYDVIKTHDHKVHVTNGKLVFPFKETHLATLYSNTGKNVYIYCEKKTPLNNPVGKGRSGNIQPDYSFFIEPLSDVNSSILEIECKQYKRPNNDNFARAVVDYSNGRTNSKVFLANHGDMNAESINKKATDLFKGFNPERCEYFPCLNSTSDEVENFKSGIKEVLDIDSDKKILYIDNDIVVANKSVVVAILSWNSEPQDLDLSVHYTHLDEHAVVDYNNKDYKTNIRFIKDVQNGFGPEKIIICVQKNEEYKFIVEDYNHTGNIKTSEAKLEFFIDKQLIKSFEIDVDWNEEDIWDVCVIKSKRYDENNISLIFEGK